MPGLRDIRRRIKSIQSTQKITRAMKMVSAAKLRRAQDAIMAARPYSDKLWDVIMSLASRVERDAHYLLIPREVKRVALFVITADRGLCGSYNHNINRLVERYIKRERGNYEDILITVVGKKGRDYFLKRNFNVRKWYINIQKDFSYEKAREIASDLIEGYRGGVFDELHLIYNEFRSAISQRPVMEKLLPIHPPEPEEGLKIEYIYEPSASDLLESLLPRHVSFQIYRALLEAIASEHGARMTAMDAASSNAEEMIKKLTLQFNKVRQASITKELMEIVGGAEALRKKGIR